MGLNLIGLFTLGVNFLLFEFVGFIWLLQAVEATAMLLIGPALLWLLYRRVRREVSTPDGAIEAGVLMGLLGQLAWVGWFVQARWPAAQVGPELFKGLCPTWEHYVIGGVFSLSAGFVGFVGRQLLYQQAQRKASQP